MGSPSTFHSQSLRIRNKTLNEKHLGSAPAQAGRLDRGMEIPWAGVRGLHGALSPVLVLDTKDFHITLDEGELH